MEKNNTITEIFDGIAIITINRPSKLNALNRETIDELHYTLKEISLKIKYIKFWYPKPLEFSGNLNS